MARIRRVRDGGGLGMPGRMAQGARLAAGTVV